MKLTKIKAGVYATPDGAWRIERDDADYDAGVTAGAFETWRTEVCWCLVKVAGDETVATFDTKRDAVAFLAGRLA